MNLTLKDLIKYKDYNVFIRRIFKKQYSKQGEYFLIVSKKVKGFKPIKIGLLLKSGFTVEEQFLISQDLRKKIQEIYKV